MEKDGGSGDLSCLMFSPPIPPVVSDKNRFGLAKQPDLAGKNGEGGYVYGRWEAAMCLGGFCMVFTADLLRMPGIERQAGARL